MRYKASLVCLLLVVSVPIKLKTVSAVAPSQEVSVDFGSMASGESVNGLGAVHPQLNIASTNNAIVVMQFIDPVAYGGDFSGIQNVANACIGSEHSSAGFADVGSGNFSPDTKLHDYVFTFAPGTSVSEFSLRMVDFGDFNPGTASSHSAKLVAKNASGDEVDVDELSFGTLAVRNPAGLHLDACTAQPGEPGNFTFKVSGPHITRLEMHYINNGSFPTKASDPHIAFNDLSFVIESTEVQIDIRPGSHPNSLNLKAKGNLPVAVLSSPSFSAATVSPLTVTLAGAPVILKKNGTPMASLEDVNGDGLLDLMLHFSIQSLPGLTSDTDLTLVGETFEGQPVTGSDSIHLVP